MWVNHAALDTNVLVYALYADAEHHRAARALLDRAADDTAAFCVTPQILAEFYAVVTNPRRVTEAKSSDEVLNVIEMLLALPGLSLLPIPVDIVTQWIQLLREHPVTGSDVFDVQLVATLRSHGVTQLYTFNRQDFAWFSDLDIHTPSIS